MHRQTVQTADGVHIEFQQLPGSSPFRIRVIVDASRIHADTTEAGYTVAYLTIEDGGSDSAASADRHVLVVPLNSVQRGFADFTIGESGRGFPSPSGASRLISATLSHLPPDQQIGM